MKNGLFHVEFCVIVGLFLLHYIGLDRIPRLDKKADQRSDKAALDSVSRPIWNWYTFQQDIGPAAICSHYANADTHLSNRKYALKPRCQE